MEAQYNLRYRLQLVGLPTFRKVKFSITAESRPGSVLKIRRKNHGWSLRHQKVWEAWILTVYLIEFVDHVTYGLTPKALKRYGTHGLNIKWNLRHGPAWLIYRPLPWSVALCACCCAHLAIWKLHFPESGKFRPFF